MKAIGFVETGPIGRPDSLIEHELPDPVASGRDLLVRVAAVSVNPVDTKVRGGSPGTVGDFKVIGWDAAGTVEAVGPDVTLFRPGDRVFYAGSIIRPGSNAELQLVDERIVGPAPQSLGDAEAAALPLTALTAWEMLFDRLDVNRPVPRDNRMLLVVGGAGGVGSVAIQIAKRIASMTVIATASRPETVEWAGAMGADHVIDHSKPLAAEVAALGTGAPGFVFSTTSTDRHFDQILELIAPQGRLGVISGIGAANHPDGFSGKSITLCYELMYTRSLHGTDDMIEQHRILSEVSRLVDAGVLKTTLKTNLGTISAVNLREAHRMLESGKTIGKVVLEGW
ncbi:zinc-binding alcohol dehydrogenase family protein [Gordonia sp. (in: high G+C Gram-positive bacteria)]|uniref:zinc-binding alcohol dehydrogenase family protein n=1 Tax=Gordonia sp. (in: high G+C Gram-positive bacteria) TaxID=84139 RepID=UPI0016AD69DF|nr:zinc-binding alcohol dehydrogenase family protein [Gordonia sp. (in: high G+C Gram-positive bacteria)]NLG46406.1 zinc-binding alcohol dehydrogenase family protein [Gordonia sp. (in: high G+C Gram-positive bacteria)]